MPIFSAIDPSKSISRSNTVNIPHVIVPAKSVVAEPVNHRPTTRKVAGRGDYSTPSILDALRDETNTGNTHVVSDVEPNQYPKNEIVRPFSQTEVLEAWKIFVEKIDAPQLKSALGTREPRVTCEWQVEYELDTELQLNRLAFDIKPKLIGYLRNYFGNEAIEIQFLVSTNIGNQSNIPYTDAERWCSLVEKYPALAALKSKFGLDFEHF